MMKLMVKCLLQLECLNVDCFVATSIHRCYGDPTSSKTVDGRSSQKKEGYDVVLVVWLEVNELAMWQSTERQRMVRGDEEVESEDG